MSEINRRSFVGAAVASGAFTIVPRHVLGGAGHVAPNDKITVANIGMGTQGFREFEGLLADPQVQIVAVCDPNTDSNDYVEWGKGGIRNLLRRLLGDPSWREDIDGCPAAVRWGAESSMRITLENAARTSSRRALRMPTSVNCLKGKRTWMR